MTVVPAILPLNSPHALPALLTSYTAVINSSLESLAATASLPSPITTLLPHITTTRPRLSDEDCAALRDKFQGMRELVVAAEHQDEREMIRTLLGPSGSGLLEFWEAEWVAD